MSFARSLFAVSGLTMLSRVAGLARDTLTAVILGAGPVADAFFVAQRLPNLFRSLFAEGAFNASFVPLYKREQLQHGDKAAREFSGEALAVMIAILVPFSALVMIAMPWLMLGLAPGFVDDKQKFDLSVAFSRITFPYLLLISITSLQGAVLNARLHFKPAAAAPILYNIVLILMLGATLLFDLDVGYSLAWAVTLAGIVQCVWLMISCRRYGVSIPLLRPGLAPRIRVLFRQIGPGALGAGAAQINLLVSTILASTLTTGAVSWLFYADRLNQLPLGVIGIAVATTLLPVLAQHVQEGDEDKVRHYYSRAVEFVLAVGLPATIGLVMAAEPIIRTLFEHGAFSAADTESTANALRAYAIGIPAFLLVKVFAAGFFARHDTKTPVRVAIVALTTNMLGAWLLMGVLDHIGIALANGFATWVNAGLLLWLLRRRGGKVLDAAARRRIPRLLLCAGLMAGLIAGLNRLLAGFFSQHLFVMEAAGLALLIGLSLAGYAALVHFTGTWRLGDLRKFF